MSRGCHCKRGSLYNLVFLREISTKCSRMASNLKRASSDPRFAEFSDTETTDEFVARDTEVELDLRNGDGKVSTQIAFGHGGMNLMITGMVARWL